MRCFGINRFLPEIVLIFAALLSNGWVVGQPVIYQATGTREQVLPIINQFKNDIIYGIGGDAQHPPPNLGSVTTYGFDNRSGPSTLRRSSFPLVAGSVIFPTGPWMISAEYGTNRYFGDLDSQLPPLVQAFSPPAVLAIDPTFDPLVVSSKLIGVDTQSPLTAVGSVFSGITSSAIASNVVLNGYSPPVATNGGFSFLGVLVPGPAVLSVELRLPAFSLLMPVAVDDLTLGFPPDLGPPESVIPDPGLDGAVREALGKSQSSLTAADLLGLTNLVADCPVGGLGTPPCTRPKIMNLEGLGAALNLTNIDLRESLLTNVVLPSTLTNLITFSIWTSPTLTNLLIPSQVSKLTSISVWGSALASVTIEPGLTNLSYLQIREGALTDLTLPEDLSRLGELDLSGNKLTNLVLPSGLNRLNTLVLSFNPITNLFIPTSSTNIGTLDLSYSPLWDFQFLKGLTKLTSLTLAYDAFWPGPGVPIWARPAFTLPSGLTNLAYLDLTGGELYDFQLPYELPNLTILKLDWNRRLDFSILTNAPNLRLLSISNNDLTDCTFLKEVTNLSHLTQLLLSHNSLVCMAIPEGMTNLLHLDLSLNPLKTLVVPEALYVSGRLAPEIAAFRDQGVNVYAVPSPPPALTLSRARAQASAFEFSVTGPNGVFTLLESGDLRSWINLVVFTNSNGGVDLRQRQKDHAFYKVVSGALPLTATGTINSNRPPVHAPVQPAVGSN